MMRYGSVCSGIEAASVAWHRLGWQAAWLSEIDPFPCAVLAHHYPNTPNLGDMTQIPNMIRSGQIEAPDVLVGGTPCQAFSVAGLRKGLSDNRGALSLCFIEIADEIDAVRKRNGQEPAIICWENVPGVFSSTDNAFGCFLGALAGSDCELQPTGKRWTNAGVVSGPKRTIVWRVLDAQFYGLAQRRKRVFVIASARQAFDPTQVLFERTGVRRNPAPCRESQQDLAATLEASIGRSRGAGTSPAILVPSASFTTSSFGQYQDGVGTLRAQGGDLGGDSEAILVCVHGTQDPIINDELAFPLGRNNGQENVLVYKFDSLSSNSMKSANPNSGCSLTNIAKTLDTSVPCPSKNQGGIGILQSYGIAGNIIGRDPKNGGNGIGYCDEVCYTLTKADQHGVAYAFQQNSRDEVRYIDGSGAIVGALAAQAGAKQQNYLFELSDCRMQIHMAIRRLLPVECERLQGFPDNYTCIPYRNKSADLCPDSPRYKAIGNSMAVPVMAWLGQQIQTYLDRLAAQERAA